MMYVIILYVQQYHIQRISIMKTKNTITVLKIPFCNTNYLLHVFFSLFENLKNLPIYSADFHKSENLFCANEVSISKQASKQASKI